MERQTSQWTQSEIDAFSVLYWSRYVSRFNAISVAALVILLWDHCLTFRQEVEFIWPSRANFVKRAFLLNRYVGPVVLVVNMHTQSGLNTGGLSDNMGRCKLTSSQFCKVWTMAVFTLAGFSVSISQCWMHRSPRTDGSRGLLSSVFMRRLLSFEVIVCTLVLYNALSRPREGNEMLLKVLHRDGFMFFSVTIGRWVLIVRPALRALNLIMAFLDIPTQMFLGIYCIWGFVMTTVSRMIINTRAGEIGDNDETLADDQIRNITSMQFSSQTKTTVSLVSINRESGVGSGLGKKLSQLRGIGKQPDFPEGSMSRYDKSSRIGGIWHSDRIWVSQSHNQEVHGGFKWVSMESSNEYLLLNNLAFTNVSLVMHGNALTAFGELGPVVINVGRMQEYQRSSPYSRNTSPPNVASPRSAAVYQLTFSEL
ncbi:hypothetical protein BU17DRAFT_70329 [Hysterangium stoloniferum]|nr:hypothetical protein BU17DRAFT_70329 [Hysterangium stoloniferum]